MSKIVLDLSGRRYWLKVLKWSLAGFLLRLLISPWALHFDLFQNDIVSDNFIRFGRWAFDLRVMMYYYLPMIYILKAPWMGLSHLFSPDLSAWLVESQGFTYQARHWDLWQMVLLNVNGGFHVFRNIFLCKAFYFICDGAIVALLLKIAPDRRSALLMLKLWVLNVVVLHSVYLHAGYDLIPAVLTVGAIVAASRGRSYTAIVLLLAGGFCKVYPFLIIPPLILLINRDTRIRFRLAVGTALTGLALFLALRLATGWQLVGVLDAAGPMMADFSVRAVNLARKLLFGFCYIGILTYLWFRRKPSEGLTELNLIFLIPILLLFAFQPIGFRYWIWISPFVVILLAERKEYWPLFVLNLLTLLVLRVFPQQSLQLGIFQPLSPEYFSSAPNLINVMGRLLDPILILRVANLMFVLSAFVLAVLLWAGRLAALPGLQPEWILKSGKSALSVFLVGVVLIWTFGVIIGPAPDIRKSQYTFVEGYRGEPSRLSSVLTRGQSLSKTFPASGNRIDAVNIWLSKEDVAGQHDSLVVSLAIKHDSKLIQRESRMALTSLPDSGYSRFAFPEIRPMKDTPVTLTLESRSNSNCNLAVGLLTDSTGFRTMTNRWLLPVRDPEGRIILKEPNPAELDLRIGYLESFPGHNLAIYLESKVLRGAGDLISDIRFRITRDMAFLRFYIILTVFLLSGLLLVMILDRRAGESEIISTKRRE